MIFKEVVHNRRSIRAYDKNQPLDTEKVKDCIALATLAPNSSNMQLWEFYHVTEKAMLEQLAKACFNQNTAKAAQQMVVFVTRRDLYKKRAKANYDFAITQIEKNSPEDRKLARKKRTKEYYGKAIPFLYANYFGLGFIRKVAVTIRGLFTPTYRESSKADMRIVVHKSAALAAQTFMLAMSSEGYDTCPMEGFDSKIVKRILKLPRGAEVNMIVSCGIRTEGGLYGGRFRIPFEQVYKKL